MPSNDVDRSSSGSPAATPEASTPRVRLAILDDHEVLLDSLSSWIAQNAPDFDLVLSASTWLQLVHSDNFPTDLVFLDFQLKEPVSIEARVRTCRAAGAKVIVLSSLDSQESRERALAAGAVAFLSKSLPMREVMDAARTVMGVARDTSPQRDWRPLPGGAVNQSRPKLSAGEVEALKLYVAGYSTAEVAERLNVQYETAKTYLRRVREKYAKAGRPASKKADLIRRAAEDGYLL
ncbi:response regulator [Galbitalea soli]|uniref:Response regulator transcription factor n=1 Tax=Galbitalea soli TaxID=1268042 RepID=A0A7C9TS90_9MICO|nr:response regulator [Galbitalea soli]NEM92179.1 response regulator transcription factor [Galbitalea soli]NYJ31867.1 DNA-binding NarL/FixJ family response regulator [Galbitalea soli]